MLNQTGHERLQLRSGVAALGCLLALCCFSAKDSQAQSAQRNQSPDALHQLSSSVEELVKRVSPSVVQVLVTGFGRDRGRGQQRSRSGDREASQHWFRRHRRPRGLYLDQRSRPQRRPTSSGSLAFSNCRRIS